MPDDQPKRIERVLAVDDDPVVRSLVRVSLEKVAGWRVFIASSGAEALEIAANEPLDLVVLDSLMREMDGAATLAALRRAGHTTPVIFLTGKADADTTAKYLALGAAGVVKKPFDPRKLPEEILRVLGSKRETSGR